MLKSAVSQLWKWVKVLLVDGLIHPLIYEPDEGLRVDNKTWGFQSFWTVTLACDSVILMLCVAAVYVDIAGPHSFALITEDPPVETSVSRKKMLLREALKWDGLDVEMQLVSQSGDNLILYWPTIHNVMSKLKVPRSVCLFGLFISHACMSENRPSAPMDHYGYWFVNKDLFERSKAGLFSNNANNAEEYFGLIIVGRNLEGVNFLLLFISVVTGGGGNIKEAAAFLFDKTVSDRLFDLLKMQVKNGPISEAMSGFTLSWST